MIKTDISLEIKKSSILRKSLLPIKKIDSILLDDYTDYFSKVYEGTLDNLKLNKLKKSLIDCINKHIEFFESQLNEDNIEELIVYITDRLVFWKNVLLLRFEIFKDIFIPKPPEPLFKNLGSDDKKEHAWAIDEEIEAGGNKERFDHEIREKMILDHLILVKYMVKRLAKQLPACVDTENLIEVGVIGLIDAIEKYDPTKNIKFKTYAEFRIRGAILDELRSLDCTPRSVHQKTKQFENAYQGPEKRVGEEATSAEIAQEMGLSVEKFNQLNQQTKGFSVINMADIEKGLSKKEKESLIGMLKYSYDEHVLEYLNYKKIRDVLSEAIEGLPARQRTVLSLYYWNEMSMREVGELIGLAESTVSSHHHRGIKHLRQKIEEIGNQLDLYQDETKKTKKRH